MVWFILISVLLLSGITTINKLKEEFPEEYAIYISLYG